MTSWSIGGVMVNTLTQNERGSGSISYFHHLHNTPAQNRYPVQAKHCMVGEPILCMHIYTYIYIYMCVTVVPVIVQIK